MFLAGATRKKIKVVFVMSELDIFDTCYAAADRLLFLSSLLRNRSHIKDLNGDVVYDCLLVDLVGTQLDEIASSLNSLSRSTTITR